METEETMDSKHISWVEQNNQVTSGLGLRNREQSKWHIETNKTKTCGQTNHDTNTQPCAAQNMTEYLASKHIKTNKIT